MLFFRPTTIAFVAFLSVFATRASAQSAPSFYFHPLNQQGVAGGTQRFTVGVMGNPTPTLRWQRLPAGTGVWFDLDNSIVFSGVTTTQLAVTTSDQSMSGDQFRCAAINSLGTTVSNSALLTVTPATPASIATNPANVTAKESESVFYSCFATSASSAPLTVRWQRLPVGGNTWNDLTAGGNYAINSYAQSSYLYVNSVALAMNGDKFRCVLTNAGGSATSTEALLTVNPADPMVISGLPPTISLSYGATLSISPAVTGTSPYTVQWFKDGIPIPYATSNYYKQFSKPDDNGVYTVAATNVTGTTTSSSVTVTVAGPVLPTIISQPASQEYSKGAQGGVWVVANGSPTFTYQWFKNGVAISGATNTSVSFGSIGFADAGEYFVKVTNDAGTVRSATAILTVLPPPLPSFPTSGWLATTTIDAFAPSINIGLSTISPGSPNATYQWYKDGVVVPGATQSTYSKYPATASDAGLYSVAVTNESGMAMSPELIINAAPTSTAPPWTDAVRLDDIVYFLAKDPGRIMRYDLAGNTWLPTVNLTPGKVPTAMLPTAEGIFVAYGTELVRRSLDLQTETPVATSATSIQCLFNVGPRIYYYDNYPTIRSRDRATLAVGPNSAPLNAGVLGQATPPLYIASANKLVCFELNSAPHRLFSFSVAPDGAITNDNSVISNNLFMIGSRWFLSADGNKIFDTGGMAFSTTDLSYQGSFGLPFDDLALLPGGELAVLRGKSVMKHSGAGLVGTGRTQLVSMGRNLFVRGSSLYVFSDPAVGGGVPGVATVEVSTLQPSSLPAPASPVGRKFSIENCFIDAYGVVNLVSRTEKALIRWNTATHAFVPTLPLHGSPVSSSYDGSVDRFVAHYRDGTLANFVPGSAPEEVAFANVPLNSPAWALVTMEDRTLATIMPGPANGTENIVLDALGHVIQNSSDVFEDPWWYWNPAARRVYIHDQYVMPEPREFRVLTVPQSNVVPSYSTGTVVNNVPITMMRAGTNVGLLLLGQEIRDASLALIGTLENPVTDGEWLGDSLFTIRVRPAGTEIQRWAVGTYVETGSLVVSGIPLRILRVNDDTLVVVTLVNGYVTFHIVPATLTSPTSYYNGPEVGLAPTILVPPQSTTAKVSSSVTFTVAVSSDNQVTYQWQQEGVNIPGATGTSYTIASLDQSDAGSYAVVATNAAGSSISNAGVLAVLSTPVGETIAPGQNAAFAVSVRGGPVPDGYQWQRLVAGSGTWVDLGDGGDYSGATTATLSIRNTGLMMTGDQFRCVVTNSIGTTISDAAALTVAIPVTWSREVVLMSGTMTTSSSSLGDLDPAWRMAGSGDFNGDGKADILLQNSVTGAHSLWLMNGTTHGSTIDLGTTDPTWQMAGTGDFNGDGKVDILWQNTATGQHSIWLMNGTANIGNIELPTTDPIWRMTGTGDFNGDGQTDILWQNIITGQHSIWLMSGTTNIGNIELGTTDPTWLIAGTGDFNGDGQTDILWQNTISGQMSLWLMNGPTVISAADFGTADPSWQAAGVGDFNGDGKVDVLRQKKIDVRNDLNGDGFTDILWQNTATGQHSIWLMNGTTYLGGYELGTTDISWQIAGTGDFNADGQTDILWHNLVTGQHSVWLMHGTTYIGGVELETTDPVWQIGGTGEFNGDGQTDILFQNVVTGEHAIWLMNGTTHVSTVSLGTTDPAWQMVGSGDFNADGHTDILWQNVVTGEHSLWLMTGTVHTDTVDLGTTSTAWQMAGTGDFNADGSIDILWQNTLTGQHSIWLMLGATNIGNIELGTTDPAWAIVN